MKLRPRGQVTQILPSAQCRGELWEHEALAFAQVLRKSLLTVCFLGTEDTGIRLFPYRDM